MKCEVKRHSPQQKLGASMDPFIDQQWHLNWGEEAAVTLDSDFRISVALNIGWEIGSGNPRFKVHSKLCVVHSACCFLWTRQTHRCMC